jgi:hypothetical protein
VTTVTSDYMYIYLFIYLFIYLRIAECVRLFKFQTLLSALSNVFDLVFHQSSMDCKKREKDEWKIKGNMLIRCI